MSCLVDRFQSEPIRLPIGWHVFIPIAVDLVIEQALIDVIDHWNAVLGQTVVLRNNTVANRPYERQLLLSEEANLGDIVDALLDDSTCGCVPIFLLSHRGIAGI